MSANIKVRIPQKDNSNMPGDQREAQTCGINYQTQNFENVPDLNKPPSIDMWDVGGCYIAMGPDWTRAKGVGGNGGGLGMHGTTYCDTIRLCAGPMATKINSGEVPTGPQNPDPPNDGATLIVSAKSDAPEKSLGLAGGQDYKSCIAMLADGVYIAGRENVEIVAGVGDKNSNNKDLHAVPGLVLRAGNAPDDLLQPFVRGDNLTKALKNIIDRITQLGATVDIIHNAQQKLNAEIAEHTHLDPLSIGLGMLATGNPFTFFDGRSFPSPELVGEGIANLMDGLMSKKDMMIGLAAQIMSEVDSLNPASANYVLARQNKIT